MAHMGQRSLIWYRVPLLHGPMPEQKYKPRNAFSPHIGTLCARANKNLHTLGAKTWHRPDAMLRMIIPSSIRVRPLGDQ
jgi:hypothetical protein